MTNLILEGQNNNLSFKMKILIKKNKFIEKKGNPLEIYEHNIFVYSF